MSKRPFVSRSRRSLFRKLLAWGAVGAAGAAHAGGSDAGLPKQTGRVAYHLDDLDRAIAMVRNLNNHLDAQPGVKIIVVAISTGLKMLVSGTEDANGNDFEALVNDLQRRGVLFKACGNTLKTYTLEPDDLHWDVEIVPSGMAELARLQIEDGCAYLKI